MVLTVPNEDLLLDLLDGVVEIGVPYTAVTEPDLNDEHTAVAVAPSSFGRHLAHLPLMGREVMEE